MFGRKLLVASTALLGLYAFACEAQTANPSPTFNNVTMTGNLALGASSAITSNTADAPVFSFIPFGNPGTSLGKLVLQNATAATATREINAAISMSATTGIGHTGDGSDGNGDKIALYNGMYAYNGSFNTFARNTTCGIDAANTTWAASWCDEIDVSNNRADAGNTQGPAGIAVPVSWGVQVVSSSSHRSTAANSVVSFTAPGRFNRGYLCQTLSVFLSCFEDHSTAYAGFQDWGTHGGFSIDLTHATDTVAGIGMANAQSISWLNSAGTTFVPAVYMDGAGLTHINGDVGVKIDKPIQMAGTTTTAALAASGSSTLSTPFVVNQASTSNALLKAIVDGSTLRVQMPFSTGFTEDTTWLGNAQVGITSHGNNNAFAAVVTNDNPANTLSFPTAVTGIAYNRGAGNTAFPFYAEAHAITTGVVTSELDTFNDSGVDAPTSYPFNRGIGTPQYNPIALTLAADRCVGCAAAKSAAAIDIGPGGVTGDKFQFGVALNGAGVALWSYYQDSQTTVGPKNGMYMGYNGSGYGILLQPTVYTALNTAINLTANGAETWGVRQNGIMDLNAATQQTIGANGAAQAPTANPVAYVPVMINGTQYEIPVYNHP